MRELGNEYKETHSACDVLALRSADVFYIWILFPSCDRRTGED